MHGVYFNGSSRCLVEFSSRFGCEVLYISFKTMLNKAGDALRIFVAVVVVVVVVLLLNCLPSQERVYISGFVCLLVGCLTSQQQASVSQGRICSDNFTCCHTEIDVTDQTFYLTQSHYTDTGPNSPSADPITPGAWQGSHWSANF